MNVFALDLEVNFEGSQVLGIYANEALAMAAAVTHFNKSAYNRRSYTLGPWKDGVAYFLRTEETASELGGVGSPAGQCYGITRWDVVGA